MVDTTRLHAAIAAFKEGCEWAATAELQAEKARAAARTEIPAIHKKMLEEIRKNSGFSVGLVGYCPPSEFDEAEALLVIKEAFDFIEKTCGTNRMYLVSGWTNVGVLALGYAEAERRNWKTIGVACARAQEHELFPVDEGYIIGEEWGDESDFFTSRLDCLMRIGGGEQSLREADTVRRSGKLTIEYNLQLLG